MNVLRRITARTPAPIRSFYCRLRDRVVDACGMSRGPGACPLRYECQAYLRERSASDASRPNA